MKLREKCAVVTGAQQGIGRGIALSMASEGAAVVVADINPDKSKAVVAEIESQGAKGHAILCDVSSKEQVDNLFDETIRTFGKVDILVNNAGIAKFKPFLEITPEEWDETININLRGQFLCAQAAARDMIKRRWGRIINIASVASGQIGIGFPNLVHYTASKGGITGMTEAMAIELGPYGINVNAIGPGVIKTVMISPLEKEGVLETLVKQRIPKGRVGTPEDIANLAVFLASEEADYITGATIFIDGGWLAT
ncbi:MAG: 3-oxoacyl-ACP reductase family protein [Armatimonadota bacterium]|nr:3-oxoacyl-ACP reductase family protein [Armatimonadota bacterium]